MPAQKEAIVQDLATAVRPVHGRTWSVEMRRKSSKSYCDPVFLDSQHYLTTLIVRDAHTRIQHNGICETLTEVRDKYIGLFVAEALSEW